MAGYLLLQEKYSLGKRFSLCLSISVRRLSGRSQFWRMSATGNGTNLLLFLWSRIIGMRFQIYVVCCYRGQNDQNRLAQYLITYLLWSVQRSERVLKCLYFLVVAIFLSRDSMHSMRRTRWKNVNAGEDDQATVMDVGKWRRPLEEDGKFDKMERIWWL